MWLLAVYVSSINMVFHKGKIVETYNIGDFNEWKNIDIIKVVIKTVDRLLGRPKGADLDLITYVTDRKGHDMRYAIDSRKLQKELGWELSLQFEEGIEETVKWYLFSKTYPSLFTLKEGSTSHLGLLPSGKKRETALLGARNRYALRMADHQRSSPCCAGWDHREREVYNL